MASSEVSSVHASSVTTETVTYIELTNAGTRYQGNRPDNQKRIIIPAVAGEKSIFLQSALQGLRYLPGCETALLGVRCPANRNNSSVSSTSSAHGLSGKDKGGHVNEEEEVQVTDFSNANAFFSPNGGGGRAAAGVPAHATAGTAAEHAQQFVGGIRCVGVGQTHTHTRASEMYHRFVRESLAQMANTDSDAATDAFASIDADADKMDVDLADEALNGQTTAHQIGAFLPVPLPALVPHSSSGGGNSSHPHSHAYSNNDEESDVVVQLKHGQSDGEDDEFLCYASNSMSHMPVYPLPMLNNFILEEVCMCLVQRSLIGKNEDVGKANICNRLGDPKVVPAMSAARREELYSRAMQLMMASAFLQM